MALVLWKEREEYGRKLRSARKKKGLTQSEVADEVETGADTISSWELGRTYPKKRFKNRLEALLFPKDEPIMVESLVEAHETMRKQMGDLMNRQRKAAGLSTGVVARALGTSEEYVKGWESGKYLASLHHLAKMEELYHTTHTDEDEGLYDEANI